MESAFRKAIVILMCILVAACAQTNGGKTQTRATQPQEAAAKGLATLKKLVNADNYRSLGFESLAETNALAIGEPFAIYNIGLKDLRAYRSGSDVNAILRPSADSIYPVLAGGQVRSSMIVTKVRDGYTPSSFGSAPLIRNLYRYRAPDSFVVRIQSLNMYFLGRRSSGALTLTPLVSDSRVKLPPGEPTPAQAVLEQLAPIANAYNGLPM